MHRKTFVGLSLISALTFFSAEAKAQWGYGAYPAGYGGYGWGGWSSTAGGDMARGLGAFAAGAGMYNEQTAVARSINTDTAIRFNNYLYLSQQESTRRYHAIKNANLAKDSAAYDAHIRRLQDSPTSREIQNGDALNTALDQLGDPRIHSSALRMATDPIDAQLIRDIPFRNASEAITITLSQFKSATKWPNALRGERFAEDRRDFEALVEQARKEDEEGDVSPDTIDKVRVVLNRIKGKLQAQPLASADQKAAINFIKGVQALGRLIEMPDVKPVLDELRNMKTTSIGNLLAFMHTFNLRFGPANTPQQRMVYDKLFPIVDSARDRIIGELKMPPTTALKADGEQVPEFFSAMDAERIEGKKKTATPAPPAPNNPK